MNKKVMIGMSGGIDSSVTAYMLQKDGFQVEGVYLKLHHRDDGYHERNLGYIKDVAEFLNIKYHVLDLADKFTAEICHTLMCVLMAIPWQYEKEVLQSRLLACTLPAERWTLPGFRL